MEQGDNMIIDDEVDWCKEGVVAEVKKQEGNVCWAFATISTIESVLFMARRELQTYSEQYLIDCDCLNKGFTIGSILKAFKFIMMKNGVVYRDSDYPFIAKKGNCECDKHPVAGMISGYKKLSYHGDEIALIKEVRKQPVASSIDPRYLIVYKKGILHFDPDLDLNTIRYVRPDKTFLHAIVIVGYGEEDGIKFWKCRNSYGNTWGEGGYFRLRREDPNHVDPFHIANRCYYPWIDGVNNPANP